MGRGGGGSEVIGKHSLVPALSLSTYVQFIIVIVVLIS